MIEIKNIPSKATYLVRQPVLRPGKPLTSCVFDGDDLESTAHFGLFYKTELAGIVSVFENKNSKFTEANQLQIRGMAVLDNCQKMGFGNLLIQKTEEYAKSKSVSLLWFNAREAAVGFYEKLGYAIIGTPFDIGDIGKHYVMYKQL